MWTYNKRSTTELFNDDDFIQDFGIYFSVTLNIESLNP